MLRRPLAVLAVLPALALAACGGDLSVGAIEDELGESVPAEVEELGIEVSGVECPADAPVEVGSTFECEVSAVENGQDVVYTATVTVAGESSVEWELTDVRLAEG